MAHWIADVAVKIGERLVRSHPDDPLCRQLKISSPFETRTSKQQHIIKKVSIRTGLTFLEMKMDIFFNCMLDF